MAINLEKRSEAATISLTKVLQTAADKGQDLGEVSAQVILVIDYSGSMNAFYTSGEVQELAERILGLSTSGLDDDGNVQVFPFHHEALEPFVVDATNYSGAIDRWRYEEVTTTGPKPMFGKAKTTTTRTERRMGGTEYAAAIEAVVSYARAEGMLEPGKPPVFVIFQTDGGSGSASRDQQLLTKYSDLPIFWEFVGLGQYTDFLDVLDTLPNRKVDNVGRCSFAKFSNIPDEQFYDTLISEFLPQWLPAARAAGIVTV